MSVSRVSNIFLLEKLFLQLHAVSHFLETIMIIFRYCCQDQINCLQKVGFAPVVQKKHVDSCNDNFRDERFISKHLTLVMLKIVLRKVGFLTAAQ